MSVTKRKLFLVERDRVLANVFVYVAWRSHNHPAILLIVLTYTTRFPGEVVTILKVILARALKLKLSVLVPS